MAFNNYTRNLATIAFGVFVGFSVTYLFMFSRPREPTPISIIKNDHPKQVQALKNSTVANQLFNEVKILCFIMTTRRTHATKAIHVLKTWGKRCNKLLFMSSDKDEEINAIPLPVKEDDFNSWGKNKEAFKYIYKNHLNEFDWFLRADDESYVVMENLRFMLQPIAPVTPIYFGCKFHGVVDQYMTGGAGYVLSREAVRRLNEEAIPNKDKCRQEDDGAEDIEIGKCLQNVNVLAGDSRDSFGKGRIFLFTPEDHLLPVYTKYPWYWRDLYYKTDEGPKNCSDYAISFHLITPNQMYVLEYLVYRQRPYGMARNPLPDKYIPTVASSKEIKNV